MMNIICIVGHIQMSNSVVYGSNRIGFAPSQNTTFTNNDAKMEIL